MIELNMYTGNSMTAADDAIIYNSLISGNGIIKGCEITFLGANQVHITSGHGMIKGRKFTVQEETIRVALASSATVPGRLYLHMDLSDTETPLQILSVAQSTLPNLTQDEDCNYNDGIYEIELATYTAGLTSITDLTTTFKTVKGIEVIESLAITESGKIMGGKTAAEEFSKINQNLNQYALKSKFAIVTGTLPTGGQGSTLQYDYSTGFTKDNCVVISEMYERDNTNHYWCSNSYNAQVIFNTTLNSKVTVEFTTASYPSLGGRNFKIVLMRTDI